jgi:hypothetical protein
MGTVEKSPERDHLFGSGRDARSHERGESNGSGRRFEIPCQANGDVPQSSVFKQAKTDPVATNVPAKKRISADDIARRVLGPDSDASISNVLVVGIERSMLLKRTEIRVGDPEQVPAVFNSLEEALQNSGFDFHITRSSGIPATEIWLTSPLHDRKIAWLSCGALTGEPLSARDAFQGRPSTRPE